MPNSRLAFAYITVTLKKLCYLFPRSEDSVTRNRGSRKVKLERGDNLLRMCDVGIKTRNDKRRSWPLFKHRLPAEQTHRWTVFLAERHVALADAVLAGTEVASVLFERIKPCNMALQEWRRFLASWIKVNFAHSQWLGNELGTLCSVLPNSAEIRTRTYRNDNFMEWSSVQCKPCHRDAQPRNCTICTSARRACDTQK